MRKVLIFDPSSAYVYIQRHSGSVYNLRNGFATELRWRRMEFSALNRRTRYSKLFDPPRVESVKRSICYVVARKSVTLLAHIPASILFYRLNITKPCAFVESCADFSKRLAQIDLAEMRFPRRTTYLREKFLFSRELPRGSRFMWSHLG